MASENTPNPSPFKPIKRIITGHNAEGKSTAIFVDEPAMVLLRPPAASLVGRLWGTRETPANNNDQTTDQASAFLPARHGLVEPNGSFVSLVGIPPGGVSPTHRTSSIDYIILISGKLTLVLEDGTTETITEPGSIIVQRGTLHTWHNKSDEWVRMVAVMMDAKPVEIKDGEGNIKETLQEGFNIQH